MIQNTNASDNFLNETNSVFETTSYGIGRVTDDHWAMSYSLSILDSNNFTIFEKNLVDVSIKHKCSTIYSTDSWKSFWNTS